MDGYIALYMFAAICLLLMLGYPVAFTRRGYGAGFCRRRHYRGVIFDPAFSGRAAGALFSAPSTMTPVIAVPSVHFDGRDPGEIPDR